MKTSKAVRYKRWSRRLLFLFFCTLSTVLCLATFYAFRAQKYDLSEIHRYETRIAVFDRNDRLIGHIQGENRIPISFEQISPKLVRAVLAREDSNFYDHIGIDPKGILRAFIRNLFEGKLVQGASTIPMQLSRNTWELGGTTKTAELDRKIMEFFLSLRIESHFSKEEILEAYANRIYMGEGNWGFEAAAQDYFGCSASELNWTQACSLAGLIRAPSILNPRINAEANAKERQQVQSRLRELNWIHPKSTLYSSLTIQPKQVQRQQKSAWLMELVEQEVTQMRSQSTWKDIAAIYTSFDLDWCLYNQQQLVEHLQTIEAMPGYTNQQPLQGAIATIDVRSGEVISLVGSRDFISSPFNRATQMRRQLGSTIKPFVYAAAFSQGVSPLEQISDDPLEETENSNWNPENADSRSLGTISVQDGLVLSRNRATIRVARKAGSATIHQLLQNAGLDPQPNSETTWLGSGTGSPLQLACAYSIFANKGNYSPAHFLIKIEDHQRRVLFSARPSSKQILSENVAHLIDDCLYQVTQKGSGSLLSEENFPLKSGGKTGTTNNFRDAWFVGYTGNYCTCVWIGLDQNQAIIDNGFGGKIALPLWMKVMLFPKKST